MNRFSALALAIVFGFFAPLFAQNVGDTRASILEKLGKPTLMRSSETREIWQYADGTRFVLENGIVTEASLSAERANKMSEAESAAPATPVEAPTVTAPQVQEPRPSPTAKPTSANAHSAAKSQARPRQTSMPWLVVGLAGGLIMLVANIIIIIAAFKESVLWGVGVFFIPIISLVFVIKFWDDVKKPFLVYLLVGLPVMLLGFHFAKG